METNVLFQSRGTISSYRNEWLGWYTSGNTVETGEGKRGAYDLFSITGIRFEDDAGRFIQYELNLPYRGKTLLKIVQGCLSEDPQTRRQAGSLIWHKGVCPDVGRLVGYAGVRWSADGNASPDSLRIGVGGSSSSDLEDYALFMPVTGNGQGSFEQQQVQHMRPCVDSKPCSHHHHHPTRTPPFSADLHPPQPHPPPPYPYHLPRVTSQVWVFGADGRVNPGHESTVKIIGMKAGNDSRSWHSHEHLH